MSSIVDALEQFDKLEFQDLRSFAAATALIAKSIEHYNEDPTGQTDPFKLLYQSESVDRLNIAKE